MAEGEIVFGYSRNSPNSIVTKADDELLASKVTAKQKGCKPLYIHETLSILSLGFSLSYNLPQGYNGG